MRIHKKLLVSTEQRVVQDRSMETDLDPLDLAQALYEAEGIPYPCGNDAVVESLFCRPQCHLFAGGVANQEAHTGACVSLRTEDPQDAGILDEKGSAVDEQSEFLTSALEVPTP